MRRILVISGWDMRDGPESHKCILCDWFPSPAQTPLPGKWCPWEFSPLGQAEMHQQIAFSETSATRSPHASLRMWKWCCSIQRWSPNSFPTFWRQGALWIPEVTLCDFLPGHKRYSFCLVLLIFILGTKLQSWEEEDLLHGRRHIGTPADSPGWDSTYSQCHSPDMRDSLIPVDQFDVTFKRDKWNGRIKDLLNPQPSLFTSHVNDQVFCRFQTLPSVSPTFKSSQIKLQTPQTRDK